MTKIELNTVRALVKTVSFIRSSIVKSLLTTIEKLQREKVIEAELSANTLDLEGWRQQQMPNNQGFINQVTCDKCNNSRFVGHANNCPRGRLIRHFQRIARDINTEVLQ